MHPETHEISWKASLSYFPNVAALDGSGEDDTTPQVCVCERKRMEVCACVCVCV